MYLGYRNPPPPGEPLGGADIIPKANANWLSIVTFQRISPLMRLGYSRPLEATDLYKLQDHHVIAERIAASFEKRQKQTAEYNTRLSNGEISPGLKGVWRLIIDQWSAPRTREGMEGERARRKPVLHSPSTIASSGFGGVPVSYASLSFPAFPSSPVLCSSR